MSRRMDHLIVMREEVIPRKGIEIIKETELVGRLPKIHLVRIPL